MQRQSREFQRILDSEGLLPALRFLNSNTPHRFTGVYRYDGDWLRNLALFDRWDPRVTKGEDAPMSQTFCAIVPDQDGTLEVVDGPTDPRFPGMQDNPVVCYCGALIRDHLGEPFGTVCHFDVNRCQAGASQIPLLLEASPLIYGCVANKSGA